MNDSERRQFTRVTFDSDARLIDPAGSRQWQTEVIDISLRGALVQRPADSPTEFPATLLLHLQLGSEIQLEFNVRVVHTDSEQLGLHFEQMDLDSASHLHRLLELNLGDPALLERELAELLDSH